MNSDMILATTTAWQMKKSSLVATSMEVQMKAKVIVAAQLLFVKLNLPHFQTSIPRLKIQSLTKTTCLSFKAIAAAQMKAMVATTTSVATPMVLQIKGRPEQQKQPDMGETGRQIFEAENCPIMICLKRTIC